MWKMCSHLTQIRIAGIDLVRRGQHYSAGAIILSLPGRSRRFLCGTSNLSSTFRPGEGDITGRCEALADLSFPFTSRRLPKDMTSTVHSKRDEPGCVYSFHHCG